MPSREQVLDQIREVFDPEIPVNIVDLGLIYECAVDAKGKVDVRMTLTTPGCPSARAIPDEVRARLAAMDGVKEVNVAVVFDPPWHPRRISAEGRKLLGIPEGE